MSAGPLTHPVGVPAGGGATSRRCRPAQTDAYKGRAKPESFVNVLVQRF
jgi:hypothetical protein